MRTVVAGLRTIVAGSRSITDYRHVLEAMDAADLILGRPSVVLSGTARGVDRLGERWAADQDVDLERYPADWQSAPRMAGLWRNLKMAENADALVAVYDGRSRGTWHMIEVARDRGLLVLVWTVPVTA